jgi:hypothetical protein
VCTVTKQLNQKGWKLARKMEHGERERVKEEYCTDRRQKRNERKERIRAQMLSELQHVVPVIQQTTEEEKTIERAIKSKRVIDSFLGDILAMQTKVGSSAPSGKKTKKSGKKSGKKKLPPLGGTPISAPAINAVCKAKEARGKRDVPKREPKGNTSSPLRKKAENIAPVEPSKPTKKVDPAKQSVKEKEKAIDIYKELKNRTHLMSSQPALPLPYAPSHSEKAQLWRALDKDLDGTCTDEEFCRYFQEEVMDRHVMELRRIRKNSMELYLALFLKENYDDLWQQCERFSDERFEIEMHCYGHFDLNGSGAVTFEELFSVLQTLHVMDTNFNAHGVRRLYSKRSCCCLGKNSKLRKAMVWIVTWQWFDRAVLMTIFANCVVLALQDYQDPARLEDADGKFHGTPNAVNQLVSTAEHVFNGIFTLEMVCKITAMGLARGHGAYLSDPWNVMDCVIVVSGLLSYLPNMPTITSLRLIRVLRPLRTMSSLPAMRALVGALISALPGLWNVLMLLGICFVLFGIFAVNVFNGVLHNECKTTSAPVNGSWTRSSPQVCMVDPIITDQAVLVGVHGSNSSAPAVDMGSRWYDGLSSGVGGYACPSGSYCGNSLELPPGSSLTAWEPQPPEYGYGYINFDDMGHAFVVIFQVITMEGWTPIMYSVQDAVGEWPAVYFVVLIIVGSFFMMNLVLAAIWDEFEQRHKARKDNEKVATKTVVEGGTKRSTSAGEVGGGQQPMLRRGSSPLALVRRVSVHALRQSKLLKKNGGKASKGYMCCCAHKRVMPAPVMSAVAPSGGKGQVENGPKQKRKPGLANRLVLSKTFEVVIVLAILFNTIVLTLDQHPSLHEEFMDSANFALTIVFNAEMLLKLLGLGCATYWRDAFNAFDGAIVIVSDAELVAAAFDVQISTSMLSAFRTFRLLRIFKLARSWKKLNLVIRTVGHTVMDSGTFILLLLLTIFIFALVGLQLFANTYKFDPDTHLPVQWEPHRYADNHPPWSDERPYTVPRTNFDTLHFSVLAVFQVLSGEDWPAIMYNGVHAVGWVAGLYFMALYCIGSLIVLNLFLAILIGHAMEEEEEEHKGHVVQEEAEAKSSAKAFQRRVAPAALLGVKPEEEEGGAEGSAKSSAVPAGMAKRSLFIFGIDHPLRRLCAAIVMHPRFEDTILALIVVAAIALVLDNPLLPPESSLVQVLYWLQYGLTWVFVCEMATRVVHAGYCQVRLLMMRL